VLAWFAAGYVNLFRAMPLVMVLLWFFLIVPQVLRCLQLRPQHRHAPDLGDDRLRPVRVGLLLRDHPRRHPERPKGQVSAASALGMTPAQAMRLVVLPQAFRNMVPLLLTQAIMLFQDTSLVYVSASPTSSAPPTRSATATVDWSSCCFLPARCISSSASRPPSW
jgi:glutamate/aspartate transport system permease protein